jgi:Na+-transporting NADH:ubiquinone oxidoreductase subunit A
MRIRVKKGLNIPIEGAAQESVEIKRPKTKFISLNLNSFPALRFKLLVKVEDRVKKGQPLVENKKIPGQHFASPAGGKVVEIRRGLKRRLLDIVIEVDENEQIHELAPLSNLTKESVLERLLEGGAFPYIHQRPFHLIADPNNLPRSIFVQAAQTLPYLPSFEKQVIGNEALFKAGIEALEKIAPVHVVYQEGTTQEAFSSAPSSEKHSVEGPHPAANLSVAIREVARIKNVSDYVWTLDAVGVMVVGALVKKGTYFTDRILSFAGSGLKSEVRGFVKGRAGFPIASLLSGALEEGSHCFISGDPLTGTKIEQGDFLEFSHLGFSVLPINETREPFHFLGLGRKKYSATRTYLSHFLKGPERGYRFTTNQHGEHRAFVDGSIYQKVMPLDIPTMHLVKALMAQDFELAEQLGAFEVVPEDFALPQFICPSKVEMMEAVEEGLNLFAIEMGLL